MREFEPQKIQKVFKYLFRRGFTSNSSMKDIELYLSDYYSVNDSKEIAFLYLINYDENGDFINAKIKNDSSTYFFIADYGTKPTKQKDEYGEPLYKKGLNIEKLNKFNIYDMNDLSSIQMMRIRAQHENKRLYMIKTDEDLLDDYINIPSSDIPDFILKSIDERKERV